jgi:hypothetical protein
LSEVLSDRTSVSGKGVRIINTNHTTEANDLLPTSF